MNRRELERLGRELQEFLESMVERMGRPERRAAMTAYLTGLLLDGDRKSVEPMASRLVDSAGEIEAMRQRLLGCVADSKWSDEEMLRRLSCKFERELPGIEALVIDDTGFPKKGIHSVGVARQYSGTLGRTDNCQVATSLHLAGEAGSGCIGFRLYLPEKWASDSARRAKAGVPEEVLFQRKWEIALSQLDAALRWGVRKHIVLADAGYGDIGEFREGVTARGLEYLMGVSGALVVWAPGSDPRVQPRSGKKGRPHTRYRDEAHPPLAISQFALTLDYRKVTWREGSRDWQASRFAVARVRTAHRHQSGQAPGTEQWLLCEWPKAEPAPCKFYLATLPTGTSVRALVRSAKLRWRVERDYQELKQEIGLDHFEGRSWRGFHHHATLCATAHAFLALRRALFPPAKRKVDPTDGPPGSSARLASTRRHLPSLPTAPRPGHAHARTVTDVEEAIQ
jgi:SRSO17 transposase